MRGPAARASENQRHILAKLEHINPAVFECNRKAMWINARIGDAENGMMLSSINREKRRMKMTEYSTDVSRMKWMLGGLAFGAVTMFLLDPDRGNRRRALARDKMYSAMAKGRKQINAKSRDLANRAKGLRAEAGSIFSEAKDSNPTEGPAA
jgi:hypothetical protein